MAENKNYFVLLAKNITISSLFKDSEDVKFCTEQEYTQNNNTNSLYSYTAYKSDIAISTQLFWKTKLAYQVYKDNSWESKTEILKKATVFFVKQEK